MNCCPETPSGANNATIPRYRPELLTLRFVCLPCREIMNYETWILNPETSVSPLKPHQNISALVLSDIERLRSFMLS